MRSCLLNNVAVESGSIITAAAVASLVRLPACRTCDIRDTIVWKHLREFDSPALFAVKETSIIIRFCSTQYVAENSHLPHTGIAVYVQQTVASPHIQLLAIRKNKKKLESWATYPL
jgi:hypothetical protein